MTETVNSFLKKAVKGTSLVFFGTLVSTLLLIATKILIVRNTTKEDLGAYTLAIAIASVFALVATLGVHEGIARFVSVLVKRERKLVCPSFMVRRTLSSRGTDCKRPCR